MLELSVTECSNIKTYFLQETYQKAKKLLEGAIHLAEAKENDAGAVKEKQSNLENDHKAFTSKLKKRKELLKMAVSFYKNVHKVRK